MFLIHLGHSALHLAAKNSHHECIRKLLQVKWNNLKLYILKIVILKTF